MADPVGVVLRLGRQRQSAGSIGPSRSALLVLDVRRRGLEVVGSTAEVPGPDLVERARRRRGRTNPARNGRPAARSSAVGGLKQAIRWVAPRPVMTTGVPGDRAARAPGSPSSTRRGASDSAARTGSRSGRPHVGRPALDRDERLAFRGVERAGSSAAGPTVYGCEGAANRSSGRRRLDDEAGVHDVDPVGHPGDDPEVVGDQDQRRAGLARSARGGARGPAPGS